MEKRIFKHKSITLPYYIKGTNPGLLLASGAHGDEHEVIDSVHKVIKSKHGNLPDFLYIPEISPSSVSGKKRSNCDGLDINREFVDETKCEEAQAVMALLKQYTARMCVSFHEDPSQEEFYLYDTGKLSKKELTHIKESVCKCGVKLFSGIDDPEDEYLGFEFKEGYRPNTGSDGLPKGPFEMWLIRNKISKRVFGVEVPGKLAKEKKNKVVECLFECLCLV